MRIFTATRRLGTITALAALPAILLFVCPVFDSPFQSAKTSLLLLFAAALSLLVFASRTQPQQTNTNRPLTVCALIWIIATCTATLHTRAFVEAWRPMLLYASAACLSLALLRLRILPKRLILCIAFSCTALALLVLAGRIGFDLPRLLTGTPAPGRMRTAATLGNPLFVASFLSAAMWSIGAFIRTRTRVVLLLITLAAIASTGERTAIAGALAGSICWLASSPTRRWKHATLTVLATATLLTATHALNPRSFRTAITGRLFIWKTSLHHLNPIGTGPGSFYRTYTTNLRELAPTISTADLPYVGNETQAHNLIVQQTVESGPFGAAALLALIGVWFTSAWKYRHDPEVRAAFASIAAFLAVSCFDNPIGRPEGILLLALPPDPPLHAQPRTHPRPRIPTALPKSPMRSSLFLRRHRKHHRQLRHLLR